MITNPTPHEASPLRVTSLFARPNAHLRWLLVACVLLGGGLFALLKAGHGVVGASAASARQTFPALQGQPAVDYLREQGLYDRLRKAAEAGQGDLARLPRERRVQKGTAGQAKNPAQRLQAPLSGEPTLPEPVQRRGRRHWQTGLRLRGARSGAQLNAVSASPARGSGINPLLTEVRKLTASDGAPGDEYGAAVAVSGDTIVIGGYRNDNRRGAVYVYERNQGGAGNWGEIKKQLAGDPQFQRDEPDSTARTERRYAGCRKGSALTPAPL